MSNDNGKLEKVETVAPVEEKTPEPPVETILPDAIPLGATESGLLMKILTKADAAGERGNVIIANIKSNEEILTQVKAANTQMREEFLRIEGEQRVFKEQISDFVGEFNEQHQIPEEVTYNLDRKTMVFNKAEQ